MIPMERCMGDGYARSGTLFFTKMSSDPTGRIVDDGMLVAATRDDSV